VSVKWAPQSLFVVAMPDTGVQSSDRLTTALSSFATTWAGPPHAKHVLVDGLKNGWLVPANAPMGSVAVYSPARWYGISAWASGLAALVGFLVLLGVTMKRRVERRSKGRRRI
jgi:hypothetical protein